MLPFSRCPFQTINGCESCTHLGGFGTSLAAPPPAATATMDPLQECEAGRRRCESPEAVRGWLPLLLWWLGFARQPFLSTTPGERFFCYKKSKLVPCQMVSCALWISPSPSSCKRSSSRHRGRAGPTGAPPPPPRPRWSAGPRSCQAT